MVITTVVAFSADAATCNFVRDLGMSTRGEDVRCLQQYLNSSGYSANFYGYNFSDGFFGPLTRQAVMNWQASNSVPVSGYFDAMSRTKYFELSGIYGRVLGVSIDNQEQRAIERIGDALNMIEDAEDEIDDSNRNTRSAKKLLEDAKEDMLDSIRAYFIDRDFFEAEDLADEAFQNAEDAFEDAGGSSNRNDRDDAEEAIDDARDAINDAEDEIDEADDDGDDVDEARDILEEAEDRLDDAKEQFNDKDYDDAEDLANEAEDLAHDAVDAID